MKSYDQQEPKVNNLVAKYDQNKGGYHGKPHKAKRSQFKQQINQLDQYDDWDSLDWDKE